jgi:hypothetical protein
MLDKGKNGENRSQIGQKSEEESRVATYSPERVQGEE